MFMVGMMTLIASWWSLITRRLDAIGMYRTVTLALLFLVVCSLNFGFFGFIPYGVPEQVASLVVALFTALGLNVLLGHLWRVSPNHESALITGLILFFLILPPELSAFAQVWQLSAVTALAILSKYLLAWQKQHIVNPAAVGLVILAIFYEVFPLPGYFESTWWIGRVEFFIPLLIAGTAVVLKVRKWAPVGSFLFVAFVMYLVEEWRFRGEWAAVSPESFWFSGPSLFLAFFMLTEPFTMPPRKPLQIVYGAAVGVISQTTLFLSVGIKMTPELALTIGNLLFYPATLRQKLILPLATVREVAKETYEFAFQKPLHLHFRAGQYLEWMLPHPRPDNRGVRRYFTISSAPSDPLLRFTVRISERCSTYKQALRHLKVGDTIIASQLAGDFLLPRDPSRKIVMVAGGIGVTPFLSHIEHMQVGSVPKHDTILFYCNNTAAEIAFKDRLQAATHTLPLKIVHVLAKEQVPPYEHGFLTAEMIARHVPDHRLRLWYLSGPPPMVEAYAKLLRRIGVRRRNIKKDFFPGLA